MKISRAAALIALCLVAITPASLLAQSCALPADMAGLRAQVIDAVNAERAAQGLSALQSHAALGDAAQGLACDNADRRGISHESSNGAQLRDRLRSAGYRYRLASENTGRGFGSPQRAVEWWMNSPHHRDNILAGRVRDIGVGIALSAAPESRLHWVINMGSTR